MSGNIQLPEFEYQMEREVEKLEGCSFPKLCWVSDRGPVSRLRSDPLWAWEGLPKRKGSPQSRESTLMSLPVGGF